MAGRTNGAGKSPGPSDSDGPRHVHKMVPGWLSPYLFAGDEQFGTRRWNYWYETLMDLKLLDAPIPQVDFLEQPDRETAKHITHMLQHAERAGMRHSEAFEQWVIWLLHGFGDSEFRAHELVTDVPGFRVPGKVLDRWYEEFQLGRLQMHPADYMAHFAQGGENGGYNPNAGSGFFSTPMSLCKAMAEMNFGTYAGDTRPLSVLDPCAGTGSLLLAASNYSLNLHAQELMLNLVRCLKVNAWLYVPWLVFWPSFERWGGPTAEQCRERLFSQEIHPESVQEVIPEVIPQDVPEEVPEAQPIPVLAFEQLELPGFG